MTKLMTPDSQEPTTEAGRALLDICVGWHLSRHDDKGPLAALTLILAVEAEARADGAADGRAQMFDLLAISQQARDKANAQLLALREALKNAINEMTPQTENADRTLLEGAEK